MTLPDIIPSRRLPIPEIIRVPQLPLNSDSEVAKKCLDCPFQNRCNLDPICCPIVTDDRRDYYLPR